MHCQKCSAENPEVAKFCIQCASPFLRLCEKCGFENPSLAKFCAQCATPLDAPAPVPAKSEAIDTSQGERRHLTVLFCDVVGSTAISAQLDAEEWRETVAGFHRMTAAAIAQFGGYVAKNLGDGVMAFFGWPQAHDNDAERAARAGLAILEAIAKLNEQPAKVELSVRVGIDSGPVVMGHGTGSEVDVFGPTSNIASRVEGEAAPGTVAISGATHRLLAGMFVVEDLGAHELKGVEQPTQLYRVVRPSGARGRFEAATAAGGLTPFVGREDELHALTSRWHRALNGEGQVALIIGEAGIGKSRLLQHFHEEIADTPHTWIGAGAGAFFQNTPFYPVIEMLRQFVGDAPPQDQIAQLETRLELGGLKPADAIPLIAPLLNLPLPTQYPPSTLSPEQQRRRLLATLVEWVLGSARSQPVVIVTEDLHWVDPSTLELIQLLVEQGATARLLLLYTARPEFHAPWPMRAHHTQLTLNRLSAGNVRMMVAQVAASKALADDTIATVIERTGGIPLFVEELTRDMLERGGGGKIPATLHDSLMARLDRLGPDKEVLQIGSVMGSEFSYELLHAVHPIVEADLQRALRAGTDAELLYVRGIAPDATYQFKHALIRDAAYEALLKTRRKDLHRTVARTIDEQFPTLKETHPEVLARHWTEAGETEIALRYFRLAGEHAAARGAMVEAEQHYRRELELLGRLPESVERDQAELAAQISLGLALWGAKAWAHPDAHSAFTRAQELAEKLGDRDQLISTLYGLWGSAVTRAQVKASQAFAERIVQLAESGEQRGLLSAGHAALGYSLSVGGKPRQAQRHFELARSYLDEGDPRPMVKESSIILLMCPMLDVLQLGFPDYARRLSDEAVGEAKGIGPYVEGIVRVHAAILYLRLHNPLQIIEHANALSRIAKENPAYIGQANEFIAQSLLMQGKHEEAMKLMAQASAYSEAAGMGITRARELKFEAQFLAYKGQLDEALTKVTEAVRETEELGAERSSTLRLRGDLLLASGAHASQVENAYQVAIASARDVENKWDELQSTTHLARWLKAQGRATEACTMLFAIYNWFTEGFDTIDLKEAKALLFELSN